MPSLMHLFDPTMIWVSSICIRDDEVEEYHDSCQISHPFSSDYLMTGGCVGIDKFRSAEGQTFGGEKLNSIGYDRSADIRLPQCPASFGGNYDNGGASLQNTLSILKDWGTALEAHHAEDFVHGSLTPHSVIALNTLNEHKRFADRAPREPYDDVYGARWAAPELLHVDDGDQRPTKMCDVYSFGCIMLQILTGSVPYCGTKRPEQVVYLKYLGREPIDAQTPKIADHYVAFLRWCWSLKPDKRPTMKTVVNFIREEIKRLEEQREYQCHPGGK